MWNALPIRKKLSLVIGGSLLISVIISTLISNSSMRSMMTERIHNEEIPATLNAVANAIEKEISVPPVPSTPLTLTPKRRVQNRVEAEPLKNKSK